MSFKFFYGIEKYQSSEVPGERLLQTSELKGTRTLLPPRFSMPKEMTYIRGRTGTSGISLSKPLGWLKSRASQQTLLGDTDVMSSQAHNS